MNYFVYNGKNCMDFGLVIATKNQFDGGKKRVEIVTVPGRNGTLSISDGTYENITLAYTLYGKKNIKNNLSAFCDYLGSVDGYARLDDSFDPDIFYKARYTEQFTVDVSDRKNVGLTVNFDCDPRKFLKSGADFKTYTQTVTLKNPTNQTAKPVIRCYGTGTLTVNDISIVISSADVYTDIDCEIEEAYKGSVNCNSNITLTDGKFPELIKGNNTITFSELTQIDLKTNWWKR